jgi:hypothetical protein
VFFKLSDPPRRNNCFHIGSAPFISARARGPALAAPMEVVSLLSPAISYPTMLHGLELVPFPWTTYPTFGDIVERAHSSEHCCSVE